MFRLPSPIQNALIDLTYGGRSVAFLEIDLEGRLESAGGDTEVFGLDHLAKGDLVEDKVDCLAGVVSPEVAPIELPFMETPSQAPAHVHIFEQNGHIWVLMLDAREEKDQRQAIQQKVNDLSLEKHRRAKILDQFLGKEVVQRLEEGIENVERAGERRQLTIMFADIRGFTTFSEKSLPEDVFDALNFYLGAMIPAVLHERGVLDKIIGDEIMAIFGILSGSENAPQEAVRAALRILVEIRKLNHLRELEDVPRLHVGVGIASGPVALGVLGSRHRKSITVIGNHVNLAARLQSKAGPGQLLVDSDTFAQLGPYQENFTEIELELKGYPKPVLAHQLDLAHMEELKAAIGGR